MNETTERRWDDQFPADILNMPKEITDLVKQGVLSDTSWGNDSMPSFEFDGYENDQASRISVNRGALQPTRYRLWVNYEEVSRREVGQEEKRFWLAAQDGQGDVLPAVFETDDVGEIVEAITTRFMQEYVWNGGTSCPWPDCESSDIETQVGSISYDDGGMDRTVICNECGREWTDVFRLVAVSITEGERQVEKDNATT